MASLLTTSIGEGKKYDYTTLLDTFLDVMTTNLTIIAEEYTKVGLLHVYSFYYNKLLGTGKLTLKQEKAVKRLFREFEENVNLDDLSLNSVIDLLFAYSSIKLGTVEFFVEIEKKIGLNINKIDPKMYCQILNFFLASRKYREKFVLLMVKKMVEKKDEIELSKLAEMLRMLSSLEIALDYPYRNLESTFFENKNKLPVEALVNIVFAYSSPVLKEKYSLVNDLENEIVSKLGDKEFSDELKVDLWRTYLIADKGEKSTRNSLREEVMKLNPTSIKAFDLKKIVDCFCRNNEDKASFEPYLNEIEKRFEELDTNDARDLVSVLTKSVHGAHPLIEKLKKRQNL